MNDANRLSKKRFKRLFAKVQGILFRDWDPLHVSDFSECLDEYDSYATTLVGLLLNGADEHKLIAILSEFQKVSMGLSATSPSVDHDREIARQLLALRDEL